MQLSDSTTSVTHIPIKSCSICKVLCPASSRSPASVTAVSPRLKCCKLVRPARFFDPTSVTFVLERCNACRPFETRQFLQPHIRHHRAHQ